MKPIVAFALLIAFAMAFTSRPDCTIRVTPTGHYEPYGDCDDCATFTIIDPGGGSRPMGAADMERYVQQYPPSPVYNAASPSLSDYLLFHHLMTGPRSTHYRTVYVNQVNSYDTYRRTHPGYRMTPRFHRTVIHNHTTVIHNRATGTTRTSPKREGLYRRLNGSGAFRSSRPSYSSGSASRSFWGRSSSSSRSTSRSSSRSLSRSRR